MFVASWTTQRQVDNVGWRRRTCKHWKWSRTRLSAPSRAMCRTHVSQHAGRRQAPRRTPHRASAPLSVRSRRRCASQGTIHGSLRYATTRFPGRTTGKSWRQVGYELGDQFSPASTHERQRFTPHARPPWETTNNLVVHESVPGNGWTLSKGLCLA